MTKIRESKLTDYIIYNKDYFLYKSLVLISTFIILFLLIVSLPKSKVLIPNEGDVVNEDIVAYKDIKYIDKEATKQNEDIAKLTTPPVYILDLTISKKRWEEIKLIISKIDRSDNYKDILDFFKESGTILNPYEYNFIKKSASENFTNIIPNLKIVFFEISNMGLLSLDNNQKENIESTGVIIGKYEDNNFVETLHTFDDINDINSINPKIKKSIDKYFSNFSSGDRDIANSILQKILVTNVVYNKEFTENRLNNRLKNAPTVYRIIKQGQILIRKGDIVTKDDILKIEALNVSRENKISLKYIIFVFIFLVFIVVFLYFLITLCEKSFFKDFRNLAFISLVTIIYVLYLSIPIYLGSDRNDFNYALFVPISTISLTFVFLYSQILSTFFSIILSVIFLVISGTNFYGFVFVFFSGIGAVFAITKVKKRTDLFLAGLLISVINLLIALLIILMSNKDFNIAEIAIICVANGVISSIIALGFIALGETMLNSPTIFRLQELSDTSSSLLKELFDCAVGTYNHSISVSNLASSAASEIGANPMLARVGGLYHDIGKIDTPEYFIENQGEFNIHSHIKPSMSAAIIKTHVKKGVELARSHRLPQEVIDIINQHHGDGLIKYFYDLASKSNDINKGEMKEDVFRYPGERPQFAESAIVLLADQVEAASRVLRKPSVSSVEKLIEGIVDEKFQEGLLDDSGLTLKDLTKIKKTFVKLIIGMYHSRIEYPVKEPKEKKDIEENNTNG